MPRRSTRSRYRRKRRSINRRRSSRRRGGSRRLKKAIIRTMRTQAEVKYTTFAIAQGPMAGTYTTAQTLMGGLAQGIIQGNFIGDSINYISTTVGGYVSNNSAANPTRIRVIVGYNKDGSQAIPLSDILQNTTSAFICYSPYKFTSRAIFKPVYDKVIHLTPKVTPFVGYEKAYRFKIKARGKKLQLDPTRTWFVPQYVLYVACELTGTYPSFNFYCRTLYTDA